MYMLRNRLFFKANVKKLIISWSILPSSRGRSIQELLNTLHTVLPGLVPVDLNSLSESSSPSDVKKAYMKSIRYIHPDKLPRNKFIDTSTNKTLLI